MSNFNENQTAYNQQPVYQQPAPAPVYAQDSMSIGAWVGTLILAVIPFVGLICLIVWACSSDPSKKSRKNWAIAELIMSAILLVLMIIASIAGVGILGAIFNSMM